MIRARSMRASDFPTRIEPMLAVAGGMPVDPQQWGFEYKWDGVRCMAYFDGRRLTLRSRNQIIITQRYPELANLGKALGNRRVILDGEIIALGAAGRPSFAELQQRMHVDAPSAALVARTPAWFVIFDILHDGAASTMDRQYIDRRALLEKTVAAGKQWHLSPFHAGDGPAMLENARTNSLEGVVAKILTSPYLPGRRSPAWRKIKIVFGQEFVIGGWIPEAGERSDRVGALLLGYYGQATHGRGRVLRYAGRVGTGFSDATHARVVAALKRVTNAKSPFADKVPGGSAIFVKPVLVAEVEYRRWPRGGMVQQASFKGLRTDKPASAIVREPQSKGAL
ncbi:MAG TPA: non-homologous end-joining DNA ligase [Tepidisphaeraceae bacterium]|jgi:bifunctional non-homologous end joining protein LigD|nr:non-homologous end-joining DNA ligase [Tepidisphaeraceae bacterium]